MSKNPSVYADIQSFREYRRTLSPDAPMVFVPTMGALHAGHGSLVAHARRIAGPTGHVVASIFVNPLQFAPTEDFTRYPRTMDADLRLLSVRGADAVFAPGAHEMYAHAASAITVDPGPLGQILEGQFRPTHFRGVCTVVLKLLNIISPTHMIMGQKDFQQQLILRRMAAEFNLPIEVITSPTVRDSDGLALSSRNRYLSPAERAVAPALFAALCWGAGQIENGATSGANQGAMLVEEMQWRLTTAGLAPQYIAIANRETLAPMAEPRPGEYVILAAALLGNTRLIDNVIGPP